MFCFSFKVGSKITQVAVIDRKTVAKKISVKDGKVNKMELLPYCLTQLDMKWQESRHSYRLFITISLVYYVKIFSVRKVFIAIINGVCKEHPISGKSM